MLKFSMLKFDVNIFIKFTIYSKEQTKDFMS